MNTILNLFFDLPEILQYVIIFFLVSSAVLLAVLLTFFLIKAVFKIRWEDPILRKKISIRNNGNLINYFRFRAEADKKRTLSFRFLADGRNLPLETVEKVEIEEIVQPLKNKTAQTQGKISPAATQAAAPDPKANGQDKKKFEGAKKAQEGAKGAVAKGRQAAGLMGTLGSLVPGEAGKALKSQSAALQATTQDAGYAVSLPDQKLTEIKSVKAQANNLTPGKKAPQKNALPADSNPGAEMVTSTEMEMAEEEPEQEIRTIRRVKNAKFAVSPPVFPGKELKVELAITPRNYYRSRNYDYSIEVEQLLQVGDELELYKEEKLLNQTAKIFRFSFVFRAISFLFSLIIAGLNLTWLIIFIRWISVNLT